MRPLSELKCKGVGKKSTACPGTSGSGQRFGTKKSLKEIGEEAFEVRRRDELRIKVLEQREVMVFANENLNQQVNQLAAVNHSIAKQEAEVAEVNQEGLGLELVSDMDDQIEIKEENLAEIIIVDTESETEMVTDRGKAEDQGTKNADDASDYTVKSDVAAEKSVK